MKTFIALLRGVNVSGKNCIKMQELSQVLNASQLKNVKTYIQSGNIIFESDITNEDELSNIIKTQIFTHFKIDIPVFIKTPKALQNIINKCPFEISEMAKSYFVLLYNTPSSEAINTVNAMPLENVKIAISSECVYVYCSAGIGTSKIDNNFFERKFKVEATTRNYNTMQKLVDLANAN